MSNRLRTILIVGIMIVWGINNLVPVFYHKYDPPAQLNSAVLTLIGALVVTYKKEDNDDRE